MPHLRGPKSLGGGGAPGISLFGGGCSLRRYATPPPPLFMWGQQGFF